MSICRTTRRTIAVALWLAATSQAQNNRLAAGPPAIQAGREAAALALQVPQHPAQGATAEAILQRALTLNPASVAANTRYGELLLHHQDLSGALDHFEAALHTDPDNDAARTGERTAALALALRARAAGHDQDALQTLQRARAALPDDPEILLDTGIQALNLHRLSLAHDALQTALTLDPANAKAIYALARVEVEQEHFTDAETHFRAYLQQHPEDATAHYGLGHLYQIRQQLEAARQEFARSIALKPVQTESYYQLGQIALDAHDDAEARAAFDRTVARMQTHAGALTGMGILAYRAKDYPGAVPWLRRAVAAAPEYQPPHYYLGLTLRRLGQRQEAEQELATAVALAAQQQGKGQPLPAP